MKVEITHGDKILFPKDKITKEDMIDYYSKVAPYILPQMKNRLIVLKRYPNGIKEEGFIQKQAADYFPSWIKKKTFKTKEGKLMSMIYCNDIDTLIYLANQGTITFHLWLSQIDALDKADRIIFDLDPGTSSFSSVIQAAKDLRDILEKELKLKCYLMSTGSKGLHIYIFLSKKIEFDQTRGFAKQVAGLMSSRSPNLYTNQASKAKRQNKVFIDYLRNGFGQTAVCPYALRALDGAPVAIPISWEELKGSIDPQSFHMKNFFKKVLQKSNPWASVKKCSIISALKKINS